MKCVSPSKALANQNASHSERRGHFEEFITMGQLDCQNIDQLSQGRTKRYTYTGQISSGSNINGVYGSSQTCPDSVWTQNFPDANYNGMYDKDTRMLAYNLELYTHRSNNQLCMWWEVTTSNWWIGWCPDQGPRVGYAWLEQGIRCPSGQSQSGTSLWRRSGNGEMLAGLVGALTYQPDTTTSANFNNYGGSQSSPLCPQSVWAQNFPDDSYNGMYEQDDRMLSYNLELYRLRSNNQVCMWWDMATSNWWIGWCPDQGPRVGYAWLEQGIRCPSGKSQSGTSLWRRSGNGEILSGLVVIPTYQPEISTIANTDIFGRSQSSPLCPQSVWAQNFPVDSYNGMYDKDNEMLSYNLELYRHRSSNQVCMWWDVATSNWWMGLCTYQGARVGQAWLEQGIRCPSGRSQSGTSLWRRLENGEILVGLVVIPTNQPENTASSNSYLNGASSSIPSCPPSVLAKNFPGYSYNGLYVKDSLSQNLEVYRHTKNSQKCMWWDMFYNNWWMGWCPNQGVRVGQAFLEQGIRCPTGHSQGGTSLWRRAGDYENLSGTVLEQNSNYFVSSVNTDSQPAYMTNIDYLGKGYNIYKANPVTSHHDPGFTKALLALTYQRSDTSADRRWYKPDSVDISSSVSCSGGAVTNNIEGTKSYSNMLDINLSLLNSNASTGRFSLSDDFKRIKKEEDSSKSFFQFTEAECFVYNAIIHNDIKLHPSFERSIRSLPQKYDPKVYKKFVDDYGTHYVYEINMGAKTVMENSFSQIGISSLLQYENKLEAFAKINFFQKFELNITLDVTVSTEEQALYNSSIINQRRYFLGAPLGDNWDEWMSRTLEDPFPLEKTLRGIEELFTSDYLPDMDPNELELKLINLEKILESYCDLSPGCVKEVYDVEKLRLVPLKSTFSTSSSLTCPTGTSLLYCGVHDQSQGMDQFGNPFVSINRFTSPSSGNKSCSCFDDATLACNGWCSNYASDVTFAKGSGNAVCPENTQVIGCQLHDQNGVRSFYPDQGTRSCICETSVWRATGQCIASCSGNLISYEVVQQNGRGAITAKCSYPDDYVLGCGIRSTYRSYETWAFVNSPRSCQCFDKDGADCYAFCGRFDMTPSKAKGKMLQSMDSHLTNLWDSNSNPSMDLDIGTASATDSDIDYPLATESYHENHWATDSEIENSPATESDIEYPSATESDIDYPSATESDIEYPSARQSYHGNTWEEESDVEYSTALEPDENYILKEFWRVQGAQSKFQIRCLRLSPDASFGKGKPPQRQIDQLLDAFRQKYRKFDFFSTPSKKSPIVKTTNWRIDFQNKLIRRGGKEFLNLQIQSNQDGITTYSQVFVEDPNKAFFKVERIIYAFKESMSNRNFVLLSQSNSSNGPCPS